MVEVGDVVFEVIVRWNIFCIGLISLDLVVLVFVWFVIVVVLRLVLGLGRLFS